ncbi:hypothetical protein [Francisella tularensis]|uniref:hypothetical protein n=1 Tax=Francisella tularensis TaxID=263 RepID=UPI0003F93402|nr:hypothetical protein [Francisella tularensis]
MVTGFGTYWLLAGLCVIAFSTTFILQSLIESAAKITQNSNFLADTLEYAKTYKATYSFVIYYQRYFFMYSLEQSVQSWLPTFNTKVLHLSAIN